MKRILLSAFVLFTACYANAQLISVGFEEVYVHPDMDIMDGGELVNLDGYITYQMFAYCTNPDDFVTQVFGNVDDPLIISVGGDGDFFQHEAGGEAGPLQNALMSFFPLYQYDSYMTIGWHIDNVLEPGYGTATVLQDAGDSWVGEFNAGDDIIVDSFTGGSYFILPGSTNGIAGDDLKVCLGQFTVNNFLEFSGLVQVFTNGEANDEFELDFYSAFATTSTGGVGCTDPLADNYDNTAVVDDGSCEYPCTLVISFSDLVITDNTCFGDFEGVVDITGVTGAQGTVLHSTNGGNFVLGSEFDGLPAGDYTYSVEDNEGCTASVDYTISEGTQIEILANNLDSDNPSCFGFEDGQVCVDISGGVGPYFTNLAVEDFTAETSDLCFTGVGAGNHVVWVQDANGCVNNSNAVVLMDPNEMDITLVPFTASTCADIADGCGTALATGGVPPIEYSIDGWVDAQTENNLCGLLANMDYTVVATDANGCLTSGTLTGITGPSQVGVNANAITDVSCVASEDGGITVSGFGGNGTFAYSIGDCEGFDNFDGIFDGLAPGDYVICAESDGCSGSETFTVNAPNAIQFMLTPTVENGGVSDAGECDATYEVINEGGGTGDLTIIWTVNGDDQPEGDTVDGLCEDDVVSITISDENGCEQTQEFDVTIGVYELLNNINVTMYPNPTNGMINLSIEGLAGQDVSARVLNSLGAEVQNIDFGTLSGIWNQEINIQGEANGIYFLNITVGNENISHRVIKQ